MSYMRTIARDVSRERMKRDIPNVNKNMDKEDKSGTKYWRLYTDGVYHMLSTGKKTGEN